MVSGDRCAASAAASRFGCVPRGGLVCAGFTREWRNRQTRTVQVRVPERAWGFNSPLAHVTVCQHTAIDGHGSPVGSVAVVVRGGGRPDPVVVHQVRIGGAATVRWCSFGRALRPDRPRGRPASARLLGAPMILCRLATLVCALVVPVVGLWPSATSATPYPTITSARSAPFTVNPDLRPVQVTVDWDGV